MCSLFFYWYTERSEGYKYIEPRARLNVVKNAYLANQIALVIWNFGAVTEGLAQSKQHSMPYESKSEINELATIYSSAIYSILSVSLYILIRDQPWWS